MADKVYTINKGINKAIEFKGLKAQYIWYVAGVLIGVLLLYGVLYVAGISSWICIPVAFGAGGLVTSRVYRISKKYGQYGLMKMRARKGVPSALLSGSRKFFIHLYSDHASTIR